MDGAGLVGLPERLDCAWSACVTPPALAPGAVHVWRVRLEGHEERDRLLAAALSAEELRRAGRYRFEADRRRFVVRRAALRAILGGYLGARGAELRFGAGEHGKPFLDRARHGRTLRFNASSSHELALIAVSRQAELGVDVERRRPLRDLAGMVSQCLSPRERLALAAVPGPGRLDAFLGGWTLKEAYLKACGDGLTRGLDRVEVSIDAGAPPRLLATFDRPGDEARWTLHRLDAGGGYLAALAVEGRLDGLQTRHWPRRRGAPG
jgi:4'-phosphopantetheinyl transferase